MPHPIYIFHVPFAISTLTCELSTFGPATTAACWISIRGDELTLAPIQLPI